MKKLKLFSLLMLLFVGVTSLWAATTTTYVFQDREWTAKIGSTAANWTSNVRGGGFTSGQGVQITTSSDGANATSPKSFTNVSKIEVQYCTNKSSGAGGIKVQVGTGTEQSYSFSKSGSDGRTLQTKEFTFSPNESGYVKLTGLCSTNSVYIYSIAITEEAAKPTV